MNRLDEIIISLEKSIPDEKAQLFKEMISIIQDNILEIDIHKFNIFRLEKALNLYMLNTKDENSYVAYIKMCESSSKEEIERYYNKYITDKSLIILEKLYKILGESVIKIERRINQIGSVGGDIEKCWAFDINFVDYEIQNHKNENGTTLDNMDYWLPIIREELNVSESYFHNSNYATIWIKK